MKHRIIHTLQKYFLNPPIKLALTIGLPLPGYALLETNFGVDDCATHCPYESPSNRYVASLELQPRTFVNFEG